MKAIVFLPVLVVCQSLIGQTDSNVTVNRKVITLKEVVVRSNLNVPAFIDRVREDTTFYKAFRNLKILGYTSLNDIRMMNKKRWRKGNVEQQDKTACEGPLPVDGSARRKTHR